MWLHDAVERIGSAKALDKIAQPAAARVKRLVRRGPVKDTLSGTWLGHPLHPLLTDIPIGSFTSATVLDVLGGKKHQPAANLLVGLGLASAAPTALAGAADWSDTFDASQRVGVVHGLANLAGLGLYAMSIAARRNQRRGRATLLGLGGMTVMSVGGYLGGHLSFSRGVGVNHTFLEEGPRDWTAVIAEASLPMGKPTAVAANAAPILLYRDADHIRAIGARCSHAGGPLAEGTVDEARCAVECPWHASVFSLVDGDVVHGPATAPQPAYDVRVAAGQVEVRLH